MGSAIDQRLSFWGESEGQPRNAVLPDIYAKDFSAAVDFLGTQPFVNREHVGVLGICAGGGFVISAAKMDLYDGVDLIPWDKPVSFCKTKLK